MYQEGAEHVERDKINDGKSAATRHLLPGVVVWLGVAQFAWHAGQHDLLPRLSSGTSGGFTQTYDSLCMLSTHTQIHNPQRGPEENTPEEKQHSLREGLEVVVSVDMCAVHHGHLSEHLRQKKNICSGKIQVQQRSKLGVTSREKKKKIHNLDTDLHADDSVDEEEHGYQKSDVRQSLRANDSGESRWEPLASI